jgi:TRAP-type mannitol/chloroaromatic compound transport system permease small subunit
MDWVSTKLSKVAGWAVLAAAVISAGNAIVRYTSFDACTVSFS